MPHPLLLQLPLKKPVTCSKREAANSTFPAPGLAINLTRVGLLFFLTYLLLLLSINLQVFKKEIAATF
jgi:hypothetical protein